VSANDTAPPSALRVAVAVEQLWHRVPGGTGRATRETMLGLNRLSSLNVQGVAAWHRRDRRTPSRDLGSVAFLPLPRPVLYESWLRTDRPRVERHVGPIDVAWASAMVPVSSRAPLVATVHDLGFLDQPDHNSRRGRSFFPRAWREVRDRAHIIVCPSQIVADDCERHGVEAGRLAVVPWGVSAPISSPDEVDEVRARWGLPERFVLWVGTMEPRKNLPRLVEAVRLLGDVDLAVVGPDGWNLDGADVLAPLEARVHRLGIVDDHQLSVLYRAASVFAYPSLLEGFGLPVLEAMAHGTPVVASAGTATAEVAGGSARLVDPLDPDDIAAAIRASLDDEPETAALVAAGNKRAQELTWAATAEGYARVFHRAAGGGP